MKGLFFLLVLIYQLDYLNISVDPVSRQYFNGDFKLDDIAFLKTKYIHFNDTMPNDTIYIGYSSTGNPVTFYRDIFSGVCMDGVCKPVYLRIYWTVSGRYLGFTVERGQKLTKKEHDPFEEVDYKRLHFLLNDPRSILANYTIYELAPKPANASKIDGITGATLTSIAGYIVEGAAYTTHKLWHVTYGPTRDSILNISYDHITVNLVDSVLEHGNRQDKTWALEGIKYLDEKAEACIPAIGRMLIKGDPSLAKNAIQTISKMSLPDSVKQIELLKIFKEGRFGLKREIIKELNSYVTLYSSPASMLIDEVADAEANLITLIIQLLKEKYEPDPTSIKAMVELLDHKRSAVSEASFYFLSSLEDQEKWLRKKLKNYLSR